MVPLKLFVIVVAVVACVLGAALSALYHLNKAVDHSEPET